MPNATTSYNGGGDTTILDFGAFILLYIVSFYFMYQKYTEIIGISITFIVNAAFMIFAANYFLKKPSDFFIPLTASFSIIITTLFHFISLILIFTMIQNMNKKYIATRGTPIDLPPMYARKLETFKLSMIACFALGGIVMGSLINGKLFGLTNYNLYNSIVNEVSGGDYNSVIKKLTTSTMLKNIYPIIVLLSSTTLLILSSIQISTATELSKLTRQELIQ